jgi:hypothetical protein
MITRCPRGCGHRKPTPASPVPSWTAEAEEWPDFWAQSRERAPAARAELLDIVDVARDEPYLGIDAIIVMAGRIKVEREQARADRHRRVVTLARRCARHSRAVTAEEIVVALLGTDYHVIDRIAA